MKRLTEKHYNGKDYYMMCSGVLRCPNNCSECDELDKVVNSLGAYEDTGLTPEEIVDRLAKAKVAGIFEAEAAKALDKLMEYQKAEAEGRLVVLPCKVGDTVYQLTNKRHARGVGIAPRIVSSICVWKDGSYALCHQGMTYCQRRDFGKTWFLTHEEAEAALKGGEV